MNDFEKDFFSAAKWIALLSFAQKGFNFLVGIALARLILPIEFGRFAYLLAIIEMLTILTAIGINTSIIQNRTHPKEAFEQTGFFLSLLLIASYLIVALAASIFIEPPVRSDYCLMTVAKAVYMASGVHGILLQKNYRFKTVHSINFFAMATASVLAILVAFLGFGLKALVYQYVILHVMLAMLTFHMSEFRVRFGCRNLSLTAVFFKQGKELIATSAIEKLLSNLDNILIRRYLGPTPLGYYKRSISMANSLLFLFVRIFEQLLTISHSNLQHDPNLSKRLLSLSLWTSMRMSVFVLVGINCGPVALVTGLYGSNWSFAAKIIPAVSFFVVLNPIRNQLRNFFLANGRFIELRRIQFIEFILFAIFLTCGIKAAGLSGAGLALSIWNTLAVGLYVYRIKMDLKPFALFFLPAFFLLGTITANQTLFPDADYSLTAAKMLFFGFLFACSLWLFEKKQVKAILKSLRANP